ncbi:helix-turn-helix transcriptional regulator [Acidimangrovimonas pyrenivorans]|uniref:LuxR C-terminal-related transcriptional regulator n=1 Tax=Acidimangrovimonas pyrenivorans TaxID=2030798 RepID=A0ABV7AI35_9RHOB
MTKLLGKLADLQLKISPPRFARDPLSRERLSLDAPRFLDAPAVVVAAPAGYGKTSLLAQWRRECLARGTIVAWYSAGPRDDPEQVLHGVAQSFREAALRPTFGHALAQTGDLEAFSALLAEIEGTALDSVLIIDDAEALPAASKDALGYILRNLPANLRLFVGARSLDGFQFDDLADYGQCETVETSDLAFELDETFDLFRQKLAGRFDADSAAQLHHMTLGWPLGLQLALSAQMRDNAPLAAAHLQPEPGSKLHEHLVALLLAKLNERDNQLLSDISILDDFTVELCAAVSGEADVEERLQAIIRTTPVVQLTDQSDWMRLHALARSALLRRFEAWPAARQRDAHLKAARWLEANGLDYKAARHAFAAGETDWALDLAERSAYHTLMTQGGGGQLLDWAGVLPDEELDKRPRLLLTEAWSLALSDRHTEAGALVERILTRSEVGDALRCECDLILGGAAVFADDPDLFARLHDPWATDPPLADPLLLRVHANRSAYAALLDGEPALARLRQQRAPVFEAGWQSRYLSGWSDFIIGLSYFWEGQVRLTERIIRPALLQSEADLGRRDPFSAMLAAVLATAVWESDRPDEAQLLLADRLDVLERRGLPEALMLGFRTLSRVARAKGDEPHALELLGALDAIGTHRGLPRMTIVSLCEQIRMHAQANRVHTCQDLLNRLENKLEGEDIPQGPLWQRSIAVQVELARGLAAIAASDWRAARQPLERANTIARAVKQERLVVESAALLSLVLRESGENARSLAQEAIELADLYGLRRVFSDVHPSLTDWVASLRDTPVQHPAPASGQAAAEATPPGTGAAVANRSTVLTPREWDVLEHLSRGLSNKEIARSLDVHGETVKWHVKNLFSKLDADSRKQVVSRARLMGLLG